MSICKKKECNKKATHNYKDKTDRKYCKQHAKTNMIDIKSKRCIESDCNKHPTFNYEGEKKPLYCKQHAKTNMIDIKHKKCIESDCNKHPVFNYSNETKPLYCKEHAKTNMIDIKNKRCIENDCNKHPVFNYEGESNAIYCKQHAKTNMIDIKHKRCKTYLCDILINNQYQGYCTRCFINLFPDNKIVRNYKTKERLVADNIREKFSEYDINFDKIVADGCSKRKPDIYIDLGYQIVIVEIDENQHRSYDTTCENRRLMEISKDFNHRNIVFIRFNPDSYYESKNCIISSCFHIDSKGVCKVKPSKTDEWNDRLKLLRKTIRHHLKEKNKIYKLIHVESLFFDTSLDDKLDVKLDDKLIDDFNSLLIS